MGTPTFPFPSSRHRHWPPASPALASSCFLGSVTCPGWSAPMRQTARSCPSSQRRASASPQGRSPRSDGRQPPAASSQPEQDGSDHDHCSVVGGSLLVAGGDAPPLLEAVDEALD